MKNGKKAREDAFLSSIRIVAPKMKLKKPTKTEIFGFQIGMEQPANIQSLVLRRSKKNLQNQRDIAGFFSSETTSAKKLVRSEIKEVSEEFKKNWEGMLNKAKELHDEKRRTSSGTNKKQRLTSENEREIEEVQKNIMMSPSEEKDVVNAENRKKSFSFQTLFELFGRVAS